MGILVTVKTFIFFFLKTFKDGGMGAETEVKQLQVSHFTVILRNRMGS